MTAIVYRIDYRPPGCQEWREGVDELVTCSDGGDQTPEEIADTFGVYEGHRFGPGEVRAVREEP